MGKKDIIKIEGDVLGDGLDLGGGVGRGAGEGHQAHDGDVGDVVTDVGDFLGSQP